MATALLAKEPEIIYPESDGKPMSDNTLQCEWITVLFGNLRALYRQEANVFVGADLSWFPVQNHNDIVSAPDTLVVFGRPKGYRGSYKQWEEGDVPITVAFEILSPSNTTVDLLDKQNFYEDYGVEEFYTRRGENWHVCPALVNPHNLQLGSKMRQDQGRWPCDRLPSRMKT